MAHREIRRSNPVGARRYPGGWFRGWIGGVAGGSHTPPLDNPSIGREEPLDDAVLHIHSGIPLIGGNSTASVGHSPPSPNQIGSGVDALREATEVSLSVGRGPGLHQCHEAWHPEPRPPVEPSHVHVDAPRIPQWLGIAIGVEVNDA